jgi:hypothetical protein
MFFSRLMRVLCFIGLLSGCGDNSHGLAPVSGTVLYNGQPLANAVVGFVPAEGGGRGANGTTDKNGNYRLTTFQSDDGALVGKHRVVVGATEKSEKPKMPDGDVPQEGGMPGKQEPRKLLSPARYMNYDTSGLTADVVAGKKNVFDFDLTD